MGGEPVSTTVVDSKSTEAARGSPVADPILESAPVELLGAPTDEAASDTAVSDAGVLGEDSDVLDDGADADVVGEETGEAEVLGGAPNGVAARDGEVDGDVDGDVQDVDPQNAAIRHADVRGEDDGNCGNLSPDGEPPRPHGRPTHVTATLSESDVLLGDASAEAPLAPDTFATSAFDAEAPRTPAVWAAAEVVTEIYHGHYNQLVRLAVLLVHDVQTAEEVVQDAFEAMHLASKRLRDSEKALQYLRQTVVNRSRSVLRHRKVVDMHAPKPAPDEPSAEHAALALLERSAVAAALRSLPERQREAIALRYYADFSEADIAKAMGISKGAVKSHTARAMSSLKTILSQESS